MFSNQKQFHDFDLPRKNKRLLSQYKAGTEGILKRICLQFSAFLPPAELSLKCRKVSMKAESDKGKQG